MRDDPVFQEYDLADGPALKIAATEGYAIHQHLTILSASIPLVALRVSTTNLAFSTIFA